jgi:hypothetical protein
MKDQLTTTQLIVHCKKENIRIWVQPISGILTLSKPFPAGSLEGFTEAESAVSILYSVPTSSAGSVWGTDGGSVGGYSAVQSGMMTLHKSGCAKRFLKALSKELQNGQ